MAWAKPHTSRLHTTDPAWNQPRPSPHRTFHRLAPYYAATAWFLLICFSIGSSLGVGHHSRTQTPLADDYPVTNEPRPHHPIDDLVSAAEAEYQETLAKAALNLKDAEKAYLNRRGRRPPPRFGVWYEYAQRHNCIIVEDFFDRIYDDLRPFWALPPSQIRHQVNSFTHRISIRNGKISSRSDQQRFWIDLWQDAMKPIAGYLPDLDMAINFMDEPRIIVPWEQMNDYLQQEESLRNVVDASEVITSFGRTVVSEEEMPGYEPDFRGGVEFWELAVVGCPPESPARTTYVPEYDYSQPPPLPATRPPHTHEGYIANLTLAKSVCDNPVLQQLHGSFVEPVSTSTSAKLFPIFGGSKLPMNNDILLPAAVYWTDDSFYSGGNLHGNPWWRKQDKLIWRGAARELVTDSKIGRASNAIASSPWQTEAPSDSPSKAI